MNTKANIVEVFEEIYRNAGIPFEKTEEGVLTLTYKGEKIVNELLQRRWSVEFKLKIEVPDDKTVIEEFDKARLSLQDSKLFTAVVFNGKEFYSDYAALPAVGSTNFPIDWIIMILDALIELKLKGLEVLKTL